MNYVILGVLILLIIFYTTKEGFAQQTKLTDFLNTWHLTNNELSNTMTVTNDRIDFNKNITLPAGKMIHLGYGKAGKQEHAGTIGYDIHGTGHLAIVGAGGSPRKVKMWDDVQVTGKLDVNNKLTVHGAHKMVVGNEQGGVENNWIAKNELCIGGVCINGDHLKMLKGEKDMFLVARHKDPGTKVLDCGRDGNNCWTIDIGKDNGNQLFAIKMSKHERGSSGFNHHMWWEPSFAW